MDAAELGGDYDFAPVFEEQAQVTPAPRPTTVGTDYSSPYVPTPILARGSGVFSRGRGDIGAPTNDPLETFAPQHTKLEHRQRKVVRQRPVDPNRIRRKGIAAYGSTFPGNVEADGAGIGEAY